MENLLDFVIVEITVKANYDSSNLNGNTEAF